MIKFRAKVERFVIATAKYEGVWIYSTEGDGGEYGNLGAFFNKVAIYDSDGLLLVPPELLTPSQESENDDGS